MKKLFFVLLMLFISVSVFADEDQYWVVKGGYGTETFGLGGGLEAKGDYFGLGFGVGVLEGQGGGSFYAKLHLPVGGGSSVWFGMGVGSVAVLSTETYDGSGNFDSDAKTLSGYYWLIGATLVNFNRSDEGFYIDGSLGQSYITNGYKDEDEWVQDWVESWSPMPTGGLYIGYAVQS